MLPAGDQDEVELVIVSAMHSDANIKNIKLSEELQIGWNVNM